MLRALELAQLGAGYVAPNPMVGCVIVHSNLIIGEGWHQKYGGPHAEVNAFAAVQDEQLLKEATVYVTLEPCAHFGKTPPCCDLIIRKKVKRVVVACIDPFEAVAGEGIKRMRAAGIQVEIGLLEKEAKRQNRRFFTRIKHKRPYILLKWAQTQDGFLAKENGDSKWISNFQSRMLVHQFRHEEAAILVGAGTVAADDPELTTRLYPGRNPLRIILENQRRLDGKYKLLEDGMPTLMFSSLRPTSANIQHFDDSEAKWLEKILTSLSERNIQSVLVEGGARTLQQFLGKGLWDEIRCFVSPISFGTGIAAPILPVTTVCEETKVGDNLMLTTYNSKTQ